MNSREYALIVALGQRGPVRVPELAQEHGVSARSIRNDLQSISRLLEQNGLEPLTVREDGTVETGADFSQLQNYVIIKDFYSYKPSRRERVQLACCLICAAADTITFAQIADKLMVSRATIINDLPEIKAFLGAQGLELVSHPSKGVRADGPELDRRELLVSMDLRHMPLVRVLRTDTGFEKVIRSIVEGQERESGQHLTDESYRRVCSYLYVAVERCRVGSYLPGSVPHPTVFDGMAASILSLVAQYCGIELRTGEAAQLAELLCRCQFIRKRAEDSILVRSQFLARELIEEVSVDLDLDLTRDFALYEGLSQHLASIQAGACGEDVIGEFLRDFKDENVEVMRAVEAHRQQIGEFVGRPVSDVELVYICLHLGAAIERLGKGSRPNVLVVCSGGVGTSQLLMAKLGNYFNFNILRAVSLHELEGLDVTDIDLVISTVPVAKEGVEHVVVNPLLKDVDFLAVSDALRKVGHRADDVRRGVPSLSRDEVMRRIRPVLEAECPERADRVAAGISRALSKAAPGEGLPAIADLSLADLLTEPFIRVGVECATWEDAVRAAGAVLVERDYVSPGYVDAAVETIKVNGPYIVFSKGFAFPHESFERGSKRLGMSLVRLATPVAFHSDNDPVDFVCMLSTINQRSHLKAFFALVNLLQDADFKRELYGAASVHEIAGVFRRYGA